MKGKAAVWMGKMEVGFKDFDLPAVEPGAVLVEVIKANVCGSDLHIWLGEHPLVKKGSAMGHEFIGRILQLGDGVTTDYAGAPVKVGDRVVAVYYLTCLKCPSCLRGEFTQCQNALKFAVLPPEVSPHFHGSYATHYYIHSNQYFYKVPDRVPDAIAAGANCGFSQVFYGLDQANLLMGETLVIQGAGGLGLYACAVAKEKGANVVMIEGAPDRLKLAKAFGVDHLIDLKQFVKVEDRVEQIKKISGSDGADVVLEVAGVSAAFPEALQLVRPGGRVLSIGNIMVGPEWEIPVCPGVITRKGIIVKGIVRYAPWYLYRTLKFLERTMGKYPYELFSDREYSLAEIQQAMERSNKRTIGRAVIAP